MREPRMRAVIAAALLLAVTACGGASGEPLAEDPRPTSAAPRGQEPGPRNSGKPRPRNTAPMTKDGALVPSGLATILPSVNAPAEQVFGADFGWPQCPKGMGIPEKRTQGQPLPTDAAKFVIIGLTNGPSFVANPCLADQVDWARDRGLMVAAYAVHSYPDASTLRELRGEGPYDGDTRLGALRNAGYQSARFNLQSMSDADLESPIVWVDVEPVASFEWSGDVVANGAVIEGAVRGYREAGKRIGFYSIPTLWRIVVGDLRFGAPEWRAAGETSKEEALRRCRADWSFQGGKAFLGQWVEDNRDRNVTCPGQARELHRWFHQY